jgi:hypothetical protein
VKVEEKAGRVQIALLIDTSNSMDGLIDQARSQLWKIVNRFSSSERDGKRPILQIGLFEYGNDSLPPQEGYVRMVLPFTEDLDRVSEALFSLRTNGGSEFAGKAIEVATHRLAWSESPGDLRLIFIAGNEGFDQGDVTPANAIRAAGRKGITVNTIYCGGSSDGDASGWKNGAMLADGRFMTIDSNMQVVHIDAPQDAEIARLGVEINETYVPFGARGGEGSARQAEQDTNASSVRQGSTIQRAVSKSGSYYDNSGWDLVDAIRNGNVKLEDVRTESLPEEMRKMNEAERRAHVEAQLAKRKAMQAKIVDLNGAREKFVEAEMRRRGEANGNTFDVAMLDMVKDQAAKKGFRFN